MGTSPEDRTPQEFEGVTVKGHELKVSGAVDVNAAIEDPHRIGTEVVVIGTARVGEVGFKDDAKRGRVRLEKAAVSDLYVVSDSTDALDLLQRARAEREAMLDALLGRTEPLIDPDGEPTERGAATAVDGDGDGMSGMAGGPDAPVDEAPADDGLLDGIRDALSDEDAAWEASLRETIGGEETPPEVVEAIGDEDPTPPNVIDDARAAFDGDGPAGVPDDLEETDGDDGPGDGDAAGGEAGGA